uniref:Uncharacterized protein n=1 Tax=Rhizophagus irregularis (strain DAOM 181602 / DAOM 197198 / MUCL 43194) TaxID=747089 RepID=U9V0K9_RHIID
MSHLLWKIFMITLVSIIKKIKYIKKTLMIFRKDPHYPAKLNTIGLGGVVQPSIPRTQQTLSTRCTQKQFVIGKIFTRNHVTSRLGATTALFLIVVPLPDLLFSGLFQ